ncbi:MAG: helix-hairpin-helix domain-containing protein [Candidatus Thermoplasmatota archaeon]|nr:helix-hairpin-helix domain-containing protein [Candidatus Thermoplasmatota archaeon]
MTQDMEQDRKYLLKLWDGYEKQEEELRTSLTLIKELEAKEREKDRIIATLRELMEAKDSELRKYEVSKASVSNKVEDLTNRVRELEDTLQQERGRYKKLYYLTEEMDQEVRSLRKSLEERDNWFRDNLSFLEEMPDRIRKWKEIVNRTSMRRTLLDTLAPDDERMPEPEEPVFQKVDARGEAMKRLLSIPGMDEVKASFILDAGYDSIEKLKKAEPFDLVKVQGITPTLARKIDQNLKE